MTYTKGIRKILTGDIMPYGTLENLFHMANTIGATAVSHNGIIYVRSEEKFDHNSFTSDKGWYRTCFTIDDLEV